MWIIWLQIFTIKLQCKCYYHSVIKANKKCYPQTFIEECKYVQEMIKT